MIFWTRKIPWEPTSKKLSCKLKCSKDIPYYHWFENIGIPNLAIVIKQFCRLVFWFDIKPPTTALPEISSISTPCRFIRFLDVLYVDSMTNTLDDVNKVFTFYQLFYHKLSLT